MKRNLIILFVFSLCAFNTNAGYERSLGKSAKGLLMGDAFTTLAYEDRTLFYNPALLARHKGFSFYPLNPIFSAPNVVNDMDTYTDLGSDPADVADVLLGTPIHLGIDYAPGFKMGQFGLSAIMNYDSNFSLQNQVTPSLNVDHRYDKGFIAGVGFNVTNEIAAGASIKYIKRESIYGSYNLTGYTLLDALNAGEITDVLDSLGKIQGSGWGVDAGIDYRKITDGDSFFSMGFVLQDIYTILQTEENEDDLEVQAQPLVASFGTAWSSKVGGGFGLTLSADIKHLEKQMEFMQRVHLGMELALSPALTLFAGVNAIDNYSYGFKVNLFIVDVFIGAYSREIGEKLQQQQSDEVLVYVSLFDFTFDTL